MDTRDPTPLDFSWDDLRLFLAVYRQRTLTAAASRLGVSQSTASRRLSQLEHQLGLSLFVRTADGLVGTGPAERLVVAAEQVEAKVHELGRALSGQESEVAGVIRVAAPDGIAQFLVAPMLPELERRHPALRVELSTGNELVDLSRSEADLAIRLVRPRRGDLVALRLSRSGYGVFGSPAYLCNGPSPNPSEHRWLGWDHSLDHLPESRWLAKQVPQGLYLRTTHMGTLIAAARAGLGLVVLARPFGTMIEGLAPLDDMTVEGTTETWLVGHRELRNVPRIRAAWDFVVEQVSRLPV